MACACVGLRVGYFDMSLERDLSGMIEIWLPAPQRWLLVYDDPTNDNKGTMVGSQNISQEHAKRMLAAAYKQVSDKPEGDFVV